jgi:hypothetical protein
MPFVRVYFRETQELVFDAHDKAFQFYGGVCRRGVIGAFSWAGCPSASPMRSIMSWPAAPRQLGTLP